MSIDTANTDQKLQIASYFLLHAPTGEIHEVLKDVMKLVDDPCILSHDTLTSILRTYNTQQLVHTCIPSSNVPLMITKYNQIDPNTIASATTANAGNSGDNTGQANENDPQDDNTATHINGSESNTKTLTPSIQYDYYYHPETRQIYPYDHVMGEIVNAPHSSNASSIDLSSYRSNEFEELRTAVSHELQQYILSTYKSKKAVSAVFYVPAPEKTLILCISGQNTNLSNYWSGGIQGVYTYKIDEKQLSGTFKLNVHYFEDGNVQLHADQSLPPNTSINIASTPTDTAKSIITVVRDFESSYQNSLEEMYVNIHEQTFKQMRRFLPISKMKMNWNTAAHSLASEITK